MHRVTCSILSVLCHSNMPMNLLKQIHWSLLHFHFTLSSYTKHKVEQNVGMVLLSYKKTHNAFVCWQGPVQDFVKELFC